MILEDYWGMGSRIIVGLIDEPTDDRQMYWKNMELVFRVMLSAIIFRLEAVFQLHDFLK